MTTAIICALVVLAVIVFLQSGALLEMYGQVTQIRGYLDLVDRPSVLDLGVSQGLSPSEVGLPAVLDTAPRALVLFLSNKCETCHTIARHLGSASVPDTLWIVVVSILSSGTPHEFVEQFNLPAAQTIEDTETGVTARVGLNVTPGAIVIEDGRMVRAQTVPSVRQLNTALGGLRLRAVGHTLVPRERVHMPASGSRSTT